MKHLFSLFILMFCLLTKYGKSCTYSGVGEDYNINFEIQEEPEIKITEALRRGDFVSDESSGAKDISVVNPTAVQPENTIITNVQTTLTNTTLTTPSQIPITKILNNNNNNNNRKQLHNFK
ncbi:hypothetical protein ACTFIZ_003808 [Dictyostelium cf. discoideum]